MAARLVRVDVLQATLLDVPRPDQAEVAIDDVRLIKRQLPNDPMTLALSLNVHLTCYNVFDEFGPPERCRDALNEAWKDDHALERFPDHPVAVLSRWVFHWVIGKEAVLLEAAKQHMQPNYHAMYFHALALHRRREFEAAVDVLAPTKGVTMLDIVRGFMLSELPNGFQLTSQLYDDLAARNLNGWDLFNAQLLLRFLGRKQEAVEVSLRFLTHPDWFPPVRQDSFRRALEYCADERSAKDLLDSLHGSRADLVNAHLCVGLTALAEGNRPEAEKHFPQSIATRYFAFLPFNLSKILLARMNQDPAWPPWIQVKQQ